MDMNSTNIVDGAWVSNYIYTGMYFLVYVPTSMIVQRNHCWIQGMDK